MYFTLNKKNYYTGEVIQQVCCKMYCNSRDHAVQIAREKFLIGGTWREYGRSLTFFPYGQQGTLYTLTCYGK